MRETSSRNCECGVRNFSRRGIGHLNEGTGWYNDWRRMLRVQKVLQSSKDPPAPRQLRSMVLATILSAFFLVESNLSSVQNRNIARVSDQSSRSLSPPGFQAEGARLNKDAQLNVNFRYTTKMVQYEYVPCSIRDLCVLKSYLLFI